MKTKNSSAAPRDATPGEIRYLNYFLEFPDGEVWSQFMHIAGGLSAWVKNTAIYRNNPDAARKLMQQGVHSWKDRNGVKHVMRIDNSPCQHKWGTGKVRKVAGFGGGR